MTWFVYYSCTTCAVVVKVSPQTVRSSVSWHTMSSLYSYCYGRGVSTKYDVDLGLQLPVRTFPLACSCLRVQWAWVRHTTQKAAEKNRASTQGENLVVPVCTTLSICMLAFYVPGLAATSITWWTALTPHPVPKLMIHWRLLSEKDGFIQCIPSTESFG